MQLTVIQLLYAISSVHRVAVALGGSDRFFCEELYVVSWRTQQISLLIRMEGKIPWAINTRSCWFIECEIRGSRLVYSLEAVLLEVSIATKPNFSKQKETI